MLASTGVFTAFLWPLLARTAPHVTEVNGPFFMPIHPLIPLTTLLYAGGHVLFAIALERARVLPAAGAGLLVLGALALLVPPPPLSSLPWVLFPLAGVLFGAGLIWMGAALRGTPLPSA